MKKNPMLTALSIIFRNTGKNLRILKYGIIENGWLRVTDLDHQLCVQVGDFKLNRKLIDVGLFIKTGDLTASIGAAHSLNIEDFPQEFESAFHDVQISPLVIDGLEDLIPATAADKSRSSLQCVFVSKKRREAVATDGHLLLLKKIAVPVKESFMIDPLSLKVAACFPGNVNNIATWNKKTEKDAAGKQTVTATYITLAGDRWRLVSKVPEASEYPRYERILPDRSKATVVQWDDSLYAEIGEFLERSKALVNQKSQLVHFTDREGIVKNDNLSYFKRTPFSRSVFAMKPDQVLGLNGEILKTVISFLGHAPVTVTVGEKMIESVIWQGEDRMVLQMPLRTLEGSGGNITREQLLKEEKVPSNVFPMPTMRVAVDEAELRKAA